MESVGDDLEIGIDESDKIGGQPVLLVFKSGVYSAEIFGGDRLFKGKIVGQNAGAFGESLGPILDETIEQPGADIKALFDLLPGVVFIGDIDEKLVDQQDSGNKAKE